MRPEHRGHCESRQELDGQDLKKMELGCEWEHAQEETKRLRCPLDLGKKEEKVRKEEEKVRKEEKKEELKVRKVSKEEEKVRK